MSSACVLVGPDQVHLITDGAAMAWGKLVGAASKAVPLPHLDAAIAVRGKLPVAREITAIVSTFPDLPTLLSTIENLLKKRFRWRLWGLRDFDLYIACLHEGAPAGFMISSVDRPGFPAFRLKALGVAHATPEVSPETLRKASDKSDSSTARNVAIAANMLLAEQRKSGIVGVYGQVTSISPRGIVMQIVKRWPDEVGKPIS
ncbi:hypothetical protein ACO34A_09905 [Rhizobium sp. ACO-34A]|nr:hypothetical protein [Rhizobium sp. ACO-34A]ATN34119.1 hypothetical protein ACO34A_09905 [Rhizobium sp. ACO-34A]